LHARVEQSHVKDFKGGIQIDSGMALIINIRLTLRNFLGNTLVYFFPTSVRKRKKFCNFETWSTFICFLIRLTDFHFLLSIVHYYSATKPTLNFSTSCVSGRRKGSKFILPNIIHYLHIWQTSLIAQLNTISIKVFDKTIWFFCCILCIITALQNQPLTFWPLALMG